MNWADITTVFYTNETGEIIAFCTGIQPIESYFAESTQEFRDTLGSILVSVGFEFYLNYKKYYVDTTVSPPVLRIKL
ncbi:hypothetical protein [Clostridium felsineum]|uniref:hypothetical protein n=1 Tax=Clostridium felsineum TaxID=36839 RepID=UPI00098CC861|nr:hypothetical protein [Clostridium felsineum]URZ16854.1 hypothetical protein CLFE_029010 [Clostridium felsineum DSM 794]